LRDMCPEMETGVKSALRGAQGQELQSLLPQKWVIETGIESVSFMIDEKGNAFTQDGLRGDRDVTVLWDHDLLAMAVKSRHGSGVSADRRPTITFHSAEGEKAFELLRHMLGI